MDRQRVNQCLENYLRDMLLDQPKNWSQWLPLAQWWYNSNFHSSLKMTPFQALYGYAPPHPSLGHPPQSNIAVVDSFLRNRHRAMTQLKDNLIKAQACMKKFVDLNRTECSFGTSDWVYLKLQPYRQISIKSRQNHKLSPQFMALLRLRNVLGLSPIACVCQLVPSFTQFFMCLN
jgi:hypothetical protein